MPDSAPKFVRFVSAVTGRLVSRWGAGRTYFGAKVATPDEVKEGAAPIVWDTERVYGLTDDFCRRYSRELEQAIAHGDLLERSQKSFDAFEKKRQEQREKRRKEIAEAEKKAAESQGSDAALPTGSSPGDAPEDASSDETSSSDASTSQDSDESRPTGADSGSSTKPKKGGRAK